MKKAILLTLISLTLAACSLPTDVRPSPATLPVASTQPAAFPSQTLTPLPSPTQTTISTHTPAPATASTFCNDLGARELITSLTAAITSSDGESLASLVSPSLGMDVRYHRDGKVINYDVEHVKFVFETTYQADWGLSYGSGESTIGAFKEIVLPSLKQVFKPDAEVICNQVKTGGVTYQPVWPYPNMNHYSVHFAGSNEYGGLDWQTWVVGVNHIAGKPYIAALVHFVWEP